MSIKSKINKEKAKLEEAGSFEDYIKNRKVSIDLPWFVAAVVAAFVLGAILL